MRIENPAASTLVLVGILLSLSLLLCGCTSNSKSITPSQATTNNSHGDNLHGPLLHSKALQRQPASDGPLFIESPSEATGIKFRHQWKPKNQYEAMLLKTGFTGGRRLSGRF